MGDPGNPQPPDPAPGTEPDPSQPGWAAPNPPPPPAPEPGPPTVPQPVAPAAAPAPVPAPPPAQPQWGAPPPTWGAPPPGGAVPPAAGGGWQLPPAVAPKKRRLTWLWILIPVLLILAVSTTVVGVFVVRLATEPIDASNDYLADIKAGRYDAAYDRLCAPAQFAQTSLRFRNRQVADADARGRITSYDISGIEFPDSDRESDVIDIITTGTVERGGTTYDIRISLSRENDEWTVCSTSEH